MPEPIADHNIRVTGVTKNGKIYGATIVVCSDKFGEFITSIRIDSPIERADLTEVLHGMADSADSRRGRILDVLSPSTAPVAMTELATALGEPYAIVYEAARKMKEVGLLKFSSSRISRRIDLHLTPAGREAASR